MGQNIEIVKLQIKRGPEAQLPTLDAGEPAITTDTHKIFVGDGTLNHELAHKADLDATNVSLADKANYYDTVSSMVADSNLVSNKKCITLGYYTANDGGNAVYQIVSSGTADGSFVIALNNGLFAKLILSGSDVKAEQLGFKSDATFNCGTFLTNLMSHTTPNVTIQFGYGNYYFSQTCIQSNSNLKLQGKKSAFDNNVNTATIFRPFQTGQNYIIKLGGYSDFRDCTTYNEKQLVGYSLEWIRFSDSNYPLTKPSGSEKYGMLAIEYCACLNLNVGFSGNSRAIYMRNTWEVQIDNLYLRGMFNTDSIIYFGTCLQDGASNISAIVIKNVDAESINSTLFESASNANIADITIGHINLESSKIQGNSLTTFGEDDTINFKACTPYPLLFNIYCGGLHVNEINLQFACQGYATISTVKYVHYLLKGNTDSNYFFGDVYFSAGSTGYLGLIYNTLGLKGSCYFNTVTLADYNVSTGTAYSPKYIYTQLDKGLVEILKTNCINLNNNVLLPKTYTGVNIQNILRPYQSTITRTSYQNNLFSPAYYFNSSYNGRTIDLKIISNVTISFHGCSNWIQSFKIHKWKGGVETVQEYTVPSSSANTWVNTDISVLASDVDYFYINFNDVYVDCITVTKA
jgi:hypothetical protein